MLPRRLWWIWLLIVAALGVVFYFTLNQGIVKPFVGQQLKQQQTVAEAETSNITSFFQVFGTSVSVLANLSSMGDRDATTVKDMDAFVSQWRDSNLVGGVVLTDRYGIVQFNANILGTKEVGVSLADRDYFVQAKNQSGGGGYFIGTPVVSRTGASKGQIIVPVASALYQKSVFMGVVVASVELQPLTEHYLGELKVPDQTHVFLIGQSGELLYSDPPIKVESTNFFDAQGHPFLDSKTVNDLRDALKTTKEGGRTTTYLNPETGKTETRLVAYAPIPLGERSLLLIMAVPIQEVTGITTPIYGQLTAILLLVSLTLLLFGIMVSREIQAQKGDRDSKLP